MGRLLAEVAWGFALFTTGAVFGMAIAIHTMDHSKGEYEGYCLCQYTGQFATK